MTWLGKWEFEFILEVVHQATTGWWFQPIWKILVKMGSSSSNRGENKNIWNHHPDHLFHRLVTSYPFRNHHLFWVYGFVIHLKLNHQFLLVAKTWRSWRAMVSYFWSNYSDLTRPHPKWWLSKGNPLISGKPRLVKHYNLASTLYKQLPGVFFDAWNKWTKHIPVGDFRGDEAQSKRITVYEEMLI